MNKEVISILEDLVSGKLWLYFLFIMPSLVFSNGLLPRKRWAKVIHTEEQILKCTAKVVVVAWRWGAMIDSRNAPLFPRCGKAFQLCPSILLGETKECIFPPAHLSMSCFLWEEILLDDQVRWEPLLLVIVNVTRSPKWGKSEVQPC